MDIERTIAGLARSQRGRVGRRQLYDLGVGRHAVDDRVRRGLLVPTLPGWYRVAAAGDDPLADVGQAVHWAGPGALASHRTAVWLFAGPDAAALRPPSVELTRPGTTARTAPGVIVHRGDTTWGRAVRHGVAVTGPYRTLVELGAVVDPDALACVLEDFVHRRLVAPGTLRRELARRRGRGVRGTAALRDLLGRRFVDEVLLDSELEVRFATLLRRYGLPQPRFHHRIRAAGRSFVVDAAFVEQRVAVELDGRRAHAGESAFERDRDRDAILAGDGWAVPRFTWRQVTEAPDVVAERLRRVLATRSSSILRA